MSAEPRDERLARAAKLLREHGESATGGPWSYHNQGEFCCIDGKADSPDAELVWSHYPDDVGVDLGDEDGRYIVLMHPPVAFALADLLDRIAPLAPFWGEPYAAPWVPIIEQAVRLAAAISREDR